MVFELSFFTKRTELSVLFVSLSLSLFLLVILWYSIHVMISFEVSTKKLWYVAITAGVLLAILTGFVAGGMTQNTDKIILLFLEGSRFPLFNGLFLILTYLGGINFVVVATISAGAIFLIKKRLKCFYLLAVEVTSCSLLVLIMKDLVGRIRHALNTAVYTETSFSFPSGHTAISVVFYGVLAYILAQRRTDLSYRTNILFCWIFFMAVIGFSRMYLGVHYASDVLGGYALGFLSLSVAILLFEKYTK